MEQLSEQQLLQKRTHLLSQLSAIGDFRPGYLYQRNRKCGKSNCRCARPGDPGHSSWELSRKFGGKSHNRNIPKKALQQTQQQLLEYQRFRELVDELVRTSDQLCELKVKAGRTAKKGALEKIKKGSRRKLPLS